ncbi:CPBP family intramembrane glutamic endopeptidase [Lactococcus insecticola]|uniref:CAAX prenyl protease 2/Lysostaphin resistance protein A-like domain-containing protein n=1 Tax=Pseudolactococcus insecticola TaxID=2709158 RepID=A0A6A0B7K2_9LACT|nr:CPBP family intramembrane glutamic endopeptidase [Lactococcus insecticola]GFH40324.1 hypothetical protein Hs20B_07220 [Lactococcus insecticola]
MTKPAIFEDKKRLIDLPFGDDKTKTLPLGLNSVKWGTIWLISLAWFLFATFVTFPTGLIHVLEKLPLGVEIFNFLMNSSLFIVPFLALCAFAGRAIKGLFKPFHSSQIKFMIGMFFAAFFGSSVAGDLAKLFGPMTTNAHVVEDKTGALSKFITVALNSIGGLLGEELLTLIVFFLIYSLAIKKLNRETTILLALIGSSLVFGLYHLPTYGYNVAQSILVIGVVRFFLSAVYIRTKSIWASFLTHYAYDMILFSIGLIATLHK